MTVAAFVVIALSCLSMVVLHVRLQKRMVAATVAQQDKLDGQADAQYKQSKVFQRELRSTQLATARVSDECARLLSDVGQTHATVQDMVREVRGHGR